MQGNSITNSDFSFGKTIIEGVWVVTPFVRYDERGCFVKDYNEAVFQDKGFDFPLRETFYSFSVKNTIRGLHFQREKQMAKLVSCLTGRIFDVAVDLRAGSPTFARVFSLELSEENKLSLLIPEGCAHGFMAVSDAIVAYKCSEIFYPEYDDGIRWDDPELDVQWPVEAGSDVIVSEKDSGLQTLRSFIDKYKSL